MTAKRSKTTCLQSDPGMGKSMMAGLTAVNRPVHFVDIDRKILSAAWASEGIAKGDITVWELEEPIDATNFANRITSLIKKEKPPVQPQGWIKFGEYINAHEDPAWKAANTVVIDSLTLLNEHLKTFIMWGAGKSKFTFDQWSALKIGWMDTMSALRDLHREHNKDLIVTVHERDKGQPGEKSTGIKTESVLSGGEVSYQQVVQGVQDIKVWASIDGAFGDLIGAQMDEYYHLYVEVDDGKPRWRCRVHPDGKRSLRTSFKHSEAVHDPDFRKIWR
jgi:hypothetical protein